MYLNLNFKPESPPWIVVIPYPRDHFALLFLSCKLTIHHSNTSYGNDNPQQHFHLQRPSLDGPGHQLALYLIPGLRREHEDHPRTAHHRNKRKARLDGIDATTIGFHLTGLHH